MDHASAGSVSAGQQPGTPGYPTEPNTPGHPTEPDTPGHPQEPDTPGEPWEPDTPGHPEEPRTPGKPGEPETPGRPDEANLHGALALLSGLESPCSEGVVPSESGRPPMSDRPACFNAKTGVDARLSTRSVVLPSRK